MAEVFACGVCGAPVRLTVSPGGGEQMAADVAARHRRCIARVVAGLRADAHDGAVRPQHPRGRTA